MADTFTTNYNLRKCEVGADNNTWGGFTNTNWDLVDSTLFTQLAAKLSLAGGTMAGALNTLDLIPVDNSNRKIGSTTKVYSDIFVQQIDFYSTAATPVLNGTLSSSGTNITLKFAGTQSFIIQDSSSTNQLTFTSAGVLTATGAATFGGIVTAPNFVATSDARLKENVREIDDALSLALKLRGVRFTWAESGEDSYGVIAQEVQEHIPEAVKQSFGKFFGVEYNQLIPILIEANRVLAERVTALEGRAR